MWPCTAYNIYETNIINYVHQHMTLWAREHSNMHGYLAHFYYLQFVSIPCIWQCEFVSTWYLYSFANVIPLPATAVWACDHVNKMEYTCGSVTIVSIPCICAWVCEHVIPIYSCTNNIIPLPAIAVWAWEHVDKMDIHLWECDSCMWAFSAPVSLWACDTYALSHWYIIWIPLPMCELVNMWTWMSGPYYYCDWL